MIISSSMNAGFGYAQIGAQIGAQVGAQVGAMGAVDQAATGATASGEAMASGPSAGPPEGPPPGGGKGGEGKGPPPGGGAGTGMSQTGDADAQSLILSLLEEAAETTEEGEDADSVITSLATYDAEEAYSELLELAVQL